jgi:hypothetical protein
MAKVKPPIAPEQPVPVVAVALGTPASSTMTICERLRCRSVPTYRLIRASIPEFVDPQA